MKTLFFSICFLPSFLLGVVPSLAYADSQSDCDEQYLSAKDECWLLGDDDSQSYEVRACLDTADSAYQSCTDHAE